jgi:hypothetical protein
MGAHGEAFLDTAATAAASLRGVARGNRYHGNAMQPAIIADPTEKQAPTGIADTLGKPMILHQVDYFQVFVGKEIARFHQRTRRLESGKGPGLGYPSAPPPPRQTGRAAFTASGFPGSPARAGVPLTPGSADSSESTPSKGDWNPVPLPSFLSQGKESGTTNTPSPSLSRDVGDPQVTLLPRSVLRCPVRVFLVLPGGVRWKLRQHSPQLPTTAETGIVSHWRMASPWGLSTKTLFPWLGFNQSGFTMDGLADRLLVRAPRTHPAFWRHAIVPPRLSGEGKPLLYSRCFGEVTSLQLGKQRLVGRTGKVFTLPADSETSLLPGV